MPNAENLRALMNSMIQSICRLPLTHYVRRQDMNDSAMTKDLILAILLSPSPQL